MDLVQFTVVKNALIVNAGMSLMEANKFAESRGFDYFVRGQIVYETGKLSGHLTPTETTMTYRDGAIVNECSNEKSQTAQMPVKRVTTPV